MAKIVIAGGTGLIGQALEKLFVAQNHHVFILTRSPKRENHILWDPQKKTIDKEGIQGTEILINLCGESVGEGRWTKKRKAELLSSRVQTTTFLFAEFHGLNSLQQYLTASGINAYPLNEKGKEMKEEDAFGTDYLSQLVRQWEEAADLFTRIVPVCKLRIAMVLSNKGGALQKLMPLVKFGIASPVGSGNQCTTWVHIEDVAAAFSHAIDLRLDGVYNLTGTPTTNRLFMNELMKSKGKKMWAPNVPTFLMKWIMGEQSMIILEGAFADSKKLAQTGFEFKYDRLTDAITNLLDENKKS